MKRLFAVAVVFASLGLMFGFYLRGGSPTALASGGGGGASTCSPQNGDVNGSGAVDLSDAVTILSFLFLGNPTELVPLCAAQGASGLPDSGLGRCYDTFGAEICCDEPTLPGQDGFYATGCPANAGRFVDHGDGTVTDNCTGLMWQRDHADVNGDRRLTEQDEVVWSTAVVYCFNLSFAGHDDWRLPNVRELQSIVDYGYFNPSIDPVFGALSSSWDWSSTSNAGDPSQAWYVIFGNGHVGNTSKFEGTGYVRALRNAP